MSIKLTALLPDSPDNELWLCIKHFCHISCNMRLHPQGSANMLIFNQFDMDKSSFKKKREKKQAFSPNSPDKRERAVRYQGC